MRYLYCNLENGEKYLINMTLTEIRIYKNLQQRLFDGCIINSSQLYYSILLKISGFLFQRHLNSLFLRNHNTKTKKKIKIKMID